MELFIRIKDGEPFEHPIFGANFRQAFPHVDTENLPPEFARFVRVPPPRPVGYQKIELQYGWADGAITDVWVFVEMTPEERAEVDRLAELAAVELAREAGESKIGVTRV
jgi:hypothetical protein